MYGHTSRFRVEKNRTTGMKTKIEFQVLTGIGISDVDSSLEWLAEEYAKSKNPLVRLPKTPATGSWEITIPDGRLVKYSRNKLVEFFEENPDILKEMMHHRWIEILEHVVPKRKKRYL